jgi:hypothetical protein
MRVDLPAEPPEVNALWDALLDLADEMPVPWVLIGAQMVSLHAWRTTAGSPRTSRDGDVLVNVRRSPAGTRLLAQHLDSRGFELQGPTRLGLGHEFVRGGVSIDVLAPDNLGSRASLETLHRAHTVSVPGGTQALRRAEAIDVRLGARTSAIPIPNLLGAIILKFEAIAVDDVPDAQKADVALLLSLVTDSDELMRDLSSAERRLVMRYPEFAEADSAVFAGVGRAREAATVYRRLAQAAQ